MRHFTQVLLDILQHFFQDNRWKKKALSIVPIKWGIGVSWTQYSVLVNINAGDGSVLVTHGGIEMGQGINTKVYMCYQMYYMKLPKHKNAYFKDLLQGSLSWPSLQ